ncbi:hypothetical protein BGZ46_007824 [Entomortierella lignicola]|nr:hypothetical protein BGZ46_007824 [Entomortierella lignicola]
MPIDTITLFQNIGLTESKAKETIKNKTLAPTLEKAIIAASFDKTFCEKSTGALIYTLASTIGNTPGAVPNLDYLAIAIRDLKLKTTDQVAAAIRFVDGKKEIDEALFNEECGVGIVVTKDDIIKIVEEYTETIKDRLIKDRYKFFGTYFAGVKKIPSLKWANGGEIKQVVDSKMLEILGPKDERDVALKKKPEEILKEAGPSTNEKIPAMFIEGELSKLHLPGTNPQIKPELMAKHLKATGGKYVTRFPPEPNGFLHIGHAKAVNINFGLAKAHDGICYLRFDDTNPETEKESFAESIVETVKWLGFTPTEITYSSSYFSRLYELAIELIKLNKAYCTPEEMQMHRGGPERGPRSACIHRERPIIESLELFEKMKNGEFEEGKAILRMKMDLENGNPQFWDLVAYRILYAPHHRTGTDWCIYPTYDYTHCLVDSFENITHSLCTSEFAQSRASYYWLCDALEVYKPVQWESGRLNVEATVLSKRKIAELVRRGHVMDLDDPRLYTLPAIRRRGVPPEAINNFIHTLGVTKADTVIETARLDSFIRDYLNNTAPRLMGVMNPIKVILENLSNDFEMMLTVANKPKDPSMGEHTIPFTREIWIDGSDFKEVADRNFFRLAPGKSVGLLNVPCPITCTDVVKDPITGRVLELKARYEDETGFAKPTTYIQWVAESPKHGSPVCVDEVRLFENLFHHANPLSIAEVPEGYLSDVNEDSLKVERKVFVENGIWDLMDRWANSSATNGKDFEAIRFQLIRIGYFCLDRDSDLGEFRGSNGGGGVEKSLRETTKKIVLNRTVGLPVNRTLKI